MTCRKAAAPLLLAAPLSTIVPFLVLVNGEPTSSATPQPPRLPRLANNAANGMYDPTRGRVLYLLCCESRLYIGSPTTGATFCPMTTDTAPLTASAFKTGCECAAAASI